MRPPLSPRPLGRIKGRRLDEIPASQATMIERCGANIERTAAAAHRINRFCGGGLNGNAMAAGVRPELHRQQQPRLSPGEPPR